MSLPTEEELKGWYKVKFPDKLIESFSTAYRIESLNSAVDIITPCTTAAEALSNPRIKNVIFADEWIDWNKYLEGRWGIDNEFIIWFELESDKTLFSMRWL